MLDRPERLHGEQKCAECPFGTKEPVGIFCRFDGSTKTAATRGSNSHCMYPGAYNREYRKTHQKDAMTIDERLREFRKWCVFCETTTEDFGLLEMAKLYKQEFDRLFPDLAPVDAEEIRAEQERIRMEAVYAAAVAWADEWDASDEDNETPIKIRLYQAIRQTQVDLAPATEKEES